MKVAIIGCGTIANAAHIPAYMKNPEAEIKYFCDIIPERAEKAVETYGCGTAITDYHVALNDPEIEAVSVCTPNNMHPVIAIKQFIDEGKLGEVFHVYVSFRAHRSIPGLGGAFTTKAIAGGGALIDWGVHYLDIVMYCCGDPTPKTVTGEAFCKLGKDMKNYAYKNMWAENTKNLNGTYDVDDSVTALIRTAGPTITVNGAWAQNIGESETYIDFMGDKAGIRLQYGADFKVYTAEHGALIEYKPEFKQRNHFENEINAFIDCIKTGEKLPSHIDTVIVTAKMMQAIYDSSAEHKEITLAE